MSTVGIAKRWNEPKGFGFITPQSGPGGDDIFCHRTNITDGDCLVEGSTVYYDVDFDEGRGKYRAVQVRGGAQKGSGKGQPRSPSFGYMAQPAYRPGFGGPPSPGYGMYGNFQQPAYGQYSPQMGFQMPGFPMPGFDPMSQTQPMNGMNGMTGMMGFDPSQGFDPQMTQMPGFSPQMAPQVPQMAPQMQLPPQLPPQMHSGNGHAPQMMGGMSPQAKPAGSGPTGRKGRAK